MDLMCSFFALASGFRSPLNQDGIHFDLAHLTLEDCMHGYDKQAMECKPNRSSENKRLIELEKLLSDLFSTMLHSLDDVSH